MLLHSHHRTRWLGAAAFILCALDQTGCVDPRGRFEDFQTRLATDAGASGASGGNNVPDESYDGGPCVPPEPGSVNGPALLSIATNLAADKPILFLGTIDTPRYDGTTAVHFVYHALDSLDRKTRVGDEITVGPYAVHDGALDALVAESTLPGEANPILYGVPITSEMTLTGHICGVRPFYCGTVNGTLVGTVTGKFTGDFGITLLDGPDAVPERPRFGCGPAQFAAAL